MNLILSGGVRKVKDETMGLYYANLIPVGARILYLPIAKRTRPFSESHEKMRANMIRFGVKADIEMWTDFKGKSFEDLDKFDSIYIEGGNPFILLDEIKKAGFIEHLRKYVLSGKLVYGQSAGALIMGADMSFAEFFGTVENTVGLSDTTGLDLFNGYSIWPHYTPENDSIIRKLLSEKGFKFLALPEYSGVHFFSKNSKVCGVSSITVFNGKSKETYALGKSVKL